MVKIIKYEDVILLCLLCQLDTCLIRLYTFILLS